MPIVFAAISPHPPILIPGVGKENLEKIKKTQAAMRQLEQELYAAKPECVLIISPHGKILPEAFTINLAEKYEIGFEDFGDFATKMVLASDPLCVAKIRAQDEINKKAPLTLISEKKIDHGAGIPLYYLMGHLKEVPIIPIVYSTLDYQAHYDFGKFLYRCASRIDKRVAIVASGDLSHRLSEEAPGGYCPQGEKFDKKILALIKAGDAKGLMSMDEKFVKEACECGLKSILILMGFLSEIKIKPEILSYEGPFGVGYAVVNFKLG